MTFALILVGVALRKGLALRQKRLRDVKGRGPQIQSHARWAKPAVALVAIGLLSGPASAVWLRGWAPLGTFHGWLAAAAAVLFVVTGFVGKKLLEGQSRAVEAHAWLALGAVLLAAVAAVAGFVLLP